MIGGYKLIVYFFILRFLEWRRDFKSGVVGLSFFSVGDKGKDIL